MESYQYGYTGFYDCISVDTKNSLIEKIRKKFINKNTVEIETPTVVPYYILKLSGYLDNYHRYVVTDSNGVQYDAKQLVSKQTDKQLNVDIMTAKQLETEINNEHMLGSSVKDGTLVKVVTKNLCYPVASFRGDGIDFLRPDATYGLLMNYDRCVQKYKNIEGLCQIGRFYKKESVDEYKNSLVETDTVQILYFTDPMNSPIVDNQFTNIDETGHMLYFMNKLYNFVQSVTDTTLYFRRYSIGTTPVNTVKGYTLEVHTDKDYYEVGSVSLVQLQHIKKITAKRKKDKPVVQEYLKMEINEKLLTDKFGTSADKIKNTLLDYDQDTLRRLINKNIQLVVDGRIVTLEQDVCRVETKYKKIEYDNYEPEIVDMRLNINNILQIL